LHHGYQKDFDDSFKGVSSGYAESAATVVYDLNGDPLTARLVNEALARFTGKVRKHNASLGVTLGSWKQSRDMLTDRTQKLAEFMGQRVKAAEKLPPKVRRRKAAMARAGDFLEWEFGWVPLVTDIRDAFDTLSRGHPPEWVSARAEAVHTKTQVFNSTITPGSNVDVGRVSVSIGSRVKVTNENLWLANRLGLLNLPGVAWDLVPWSFVANMFTNLGQMVNSMTDFVGLSCDSTHVTKTSDVERTSSFRSGTGYAPGYSRSVIVEKRKNRTVGGVPTPTFQWQAPQLNLELAAIASSLLIQRVSKLNRIFGAKPYS